MSLRLIKRRLARPHPVDNQPASTEIGRAAETEEPLRDLEMYGLLNEWKAPGFRRAPSEEVLQEFRLVTKRPPFWRRLMTVSIPVPVPALILFLGLMVGIIALTNRHIPGPNVAPPLNPQIIERVRTIEVPVLKQQVVTRFIYLEKAPIRAESSRDEIAFPGTESSSVALTDDSHTQSRTQEGYVTRANLSGFAPGEEMTAKVIKKGVQNER